MTWDYLIWQEMCGSGHFLLMKTVAKLFAEAPGETAWVALNCRIVSTACQYINFITLGFVARYRNYRIRDFTLTGVSHHEAVIVVGLLVVG